jgi:hypothetical protein
VRPHPHRTRASPHKRELRIIPEEESYISSTKSEGNISPVAAELPKSFSQRKLFNPYVANPEIIEAVGEEHSTMAESRSKKFKITATKR